MDTLATYRDVSIDWLKPGDFFGAGKEFWLYSQCLVAGMARLPYCRVYPSEALEVARHYADELVQALATKGPYADKLVQALKTQGYELDQVPPEALPHVWREAEPTVYDWVVGHLAYGTIRGLPPYYKIDEYKVARRILTFADALVQALGVIPDAPLFPHELSTPIYGLLPQERRVVAILSELLYDVAYSHGDPAVAVAEAMGRTQALGAALGHYRQHNWLIKKVTPWLSSQLQKGEATSEQLVGYIAAIGEAVNEAPDMSTVEQEWQQIQLVIGVINGLDSTEVPPTDIVQQAARLTLALDKVARQEKIEVANREAYGWLSTLVLSELARRSQANWGRNTTLAAARRAAWQAGLFTERLAS